MESRHLDHAGGEVDPSDSGALARHRLAEQAPAATDIERAGAGEAGVLGDEPEAHGVQQMQRTELPARVPEPVRERVEFRQLAAVGIGGEVGIRAHHAYMLTFPDVRDRPRNPAGQPRR
jgi:hypothetical protein